MAVGIYKLPICDGCKLPWLPVGWTQDSDPRNLPEGSKPLRCGKCKSPNWDRNHTREGKANVQVRSGSEAETADLSGLSRQINEGIAQPVDVDEDPAEENELPQLREYLPETGETEAATMLEVREQQESNAPSRLQQSSGSGVDMPSVPPAIASGSIRCRHRMTHCPICHSEAAQDA